MKEELGKLQDQFAFIDLTSKQGKSGVIEILLKKILQIEIRMEQDKNHKEPHVHINYGKEKHTASYRIVNGERIVGNLSSKYDNTVKSWIATNQPLLLQIWNEIQVGNQSKYEFLIRQL